MGGHTRLPRSFPKALSSWAGGAMPMRWCCCGRWHGWTLGSVCSITGAAATAMGVRGLRALPWPGPGPQIRRSTAPQGPGRSPSDGRSLGAEGLQPMESTPRPPGASATGAAAGHGVELGLFSPIQDFLYGEI